MKKRGVTSERKIAANRTNARASTGPQTTRGRAHVARNALRHGLSLPACSNPAVSEDVEALAREIAGPMPLRKSRSSRVKSLNVKSICAACGVRDITSYPIA